MYHPSLLSKWDILVSLLIIQTLHLLPSTCTICSYCCILASMTTSGSHGDVQVSHWHTPQATGGKESPEICSTTIMMMITNKYFSTLGRGCRFFSTVNCIGKRQEEENKLKKILAETWFSCGITQQRLVGASLKTCVFQFQMEIISDPDD